MIRRSFRFLERIGKSTERQWRAQGVETWDDFLNCSRIAGLSRQRKAYYDRKIREARRELYNGNAGYFAELLPQAEHWRLYDFFRDAVVYLDIEVDSVEGGGDVLVIGMFDGIETKTMVYGINLDVRRLWDELQRYKLIVSFNGSVFDVPFLKKRYPKFVPLLPHFDVRFSCQNLGLQGGLKDVERQLGIRRNNCAVERLDGGDPLLLWKRFRATGDEDYLRLLVEYNEEDVVNLKKLAEHCYTTLAGQLLRSSSAPTCSGMYTNGQ